MSVALRIFSYVPNPRVWKATICARLCGVEVELRGAPAHELPGWLWDFDARPLSAADGALAEASTGRIGFSGTPLSKTAAFLRAHPFGNVPAAFSPDGAIGVFESNSIMRAVARLGGTGCTLYGSGAYESARIDGFLDVSLVFARDTQAYLLALRNGSPADTVQAHARDALGVYLAGIERALSPHNDYLVGGSLSLADICCVVELCLLRSERARRRELAAQGLQPIFDADIEAGHPRTLAHFTRLSQHPAFAPDVLPYLDKFA